MADFATLARALYISSTRVWPRRPSENQLAVMMYHRVGSRTGAPIDIPLACFHRQLDYLETHYRVVSLDVAVRAISKGEIQRSMVVLTFDDGYYDFYTNVLPILQRRNLPAVLYVATEFVETGRKFSADARFTGPGWERIRPLRWAELEEIASVNLVTIGAHTHTHPRLNRIAPAELERECLISRTLLRERLGVEPTHFATPYGTYTKAVSAIASRFFETVAVGGWKPNSPQDWNPSRVWRVPALPTASLEVFARSLAGAGAFLGTLAWLRDRMVV